MSKVKIQGNASGTGVVTLTAPNTNTDRTITLPDETVSLTGAPAGLDDVGGGARATSGLLFNGDTAAANALDDYEEGTWTPALRGNVTAGNTTYVSRYGTYEKIGRTVHFRGTIHVNAQGTLNGLVYITGLPFTSQATSPTSSFYIGYAGSLSITASESLTGTVQNNSTEGLLRVWNSSGGTSNFDDAELTDSAQLYFGGTYNVG